jgi:hypothetical protein
MLKVDMVKCGGGRRKVEIVAQGSIIEIMADVGQLIGGVHMQLKRNDPAIARIYRHELVRLLTDPETPLWNDDPNAEGVMIITPKFKEET